MTRDELKFTLRSHNLEFAEMFNSDTRTGELEIYVQTNVKNACRVLIFKHDNLIRAFNTHGLSVQDLVKQRILLGLQTGQYTTCSYNEGSRKASYDYNNKFDPESMYIDPEEEKKYFDIPDIYWEEKIIRNQEPWEGDVSYAAYDMYLSKRFKEPDEED